MPINKPLYQAAMFLKTGHPAYRPAWKAFVSDPKVTDDLDNLRTVAVTAQVTQPMLTRAIIRSLNGLHPILEIKTEY